VNRSRHWQGLLRADTRRQTWYAVSSLVLGLAGSVVVFFGAIWSVAFAVFGVGLLLFALVSAFGDRLLLLECTRAGQLLGVVVDYPPSDVVASGNAFGRAIARVRRPRTYRRLLAVFLGGLTGFITALVALGCWYLALRGLAEVVLLATWPEALDNAWGGSRVGALIVHTLPGVLAWFAGPFLIRRANYGRSQVLRLLLEETERVSLPAS
jgi:hypothetical protein